MLEGLGEIVRSNLEALPLDCPDKAVRILVVVREGSKYLTFDDIAAQMSPVIGSEDRTQLDTHSVGCEWVGYCDLPQDIGNNNNKQHSSSSACAERERGAPGVVCLQVSPRGVDFLGASCVPACCKRLSMHFVYAHRSPFVHSTVCIDNNVANNLLRWLKIRRVHTGLDAACFGAFVGGGPTRRYLDRRVSDHFSELNPLFSKETPVTGSGGIMLGHERIMPGKAIAWASDGRRPADISNDPEALMWGVYIGDGLCLTPSEKHTHELVAYELQNGCSVCIAEPHVDNVTARQRKTSARCRVFGSAINA